MRRMERTASRSRVPDGGEVSMNARATCSEGAATTAGTIAGVEKTAWLADAPFVSFADGDS